MYMFCGSCLSVTACSYCRKIDCEDGNTEKLYPARKSFVQAALGPYGDRVGRADTESMEKGILVQLVEELKKAISNAASSISPGESASRAVWKSGVNRVKQLCSISRRDTVN